MPIQHARPQSVAAVFNRRVPLAPSAPHVSTPRAVARQALTNLATLQNGIRKGYKKGAKGVRKGPDCFRKGYKRGTKGYEEGRPKPPLNTTP